MPAGPLPWQNVQVLNDISVGEFNRTMVAMSTWVAGTGNCAYCHNIANLASDTLPNGKPFKLTLTYWPGEGGDAKHNANQPQCRTPAVGFGQARQQR